jgi:biopolymer transport protein ExbD
MRFFIRKKRQPPAVIIVALIDVLIVVLIFLMVTTTFKKPLQSLKIALPESTHATKSGANEHAPLLVSIEASGNLRFGPDATPVTLDRLNAVLRMAAVTNPLVKLTVSADKSAPVGQMVKVLDAAKESGITNGVSIFTRQPGPQ